jgi:enoyl-CoA hydratase/carnithine racemase
MNTFQTDLRLNVLHVRFGEGRRQSTMQDSWFRDFEQVLRYAAADPTVRCIHLSSGAKYFCSGGDLQAFLDGPFPNGAMNSSLASCLRCLEDFDKPIVALVHGAAIGAGATLMLHCDFVYSEPETTFQFPFTQIGVVPELGSTWLLPLLVGHRLATELLLLGQPFDAAVAQRVGLVNEVLARPDLEERATQTVQVLAGLAPAALRSTKGLLKQAQRQNYAQAWRAECLALEQCFEGDEVKEACSAILAKRKPDFSRCS